MAEFRDLIRWSEVSGRKISVGDTAVTPRSRALTVRTRFGGLVWNRPSAVLIERDGGSIRVPIVDANRRTQAALFGLGLIVATVTLAKSVRRRRVRNERSA